MADNYQLIYFYDELGAPLGLGFRSNGDSVGVYKYYFFEKNPLGDVIGLYKFDGTKIGTYVYDAWGNVTLLPDNIATMQEAEIFAFYNPFRYRGYFYDVETNLYYLQSRYYNPQWGRFINPDAVMAGVGGDLHGYNLYAYCFNNPINMIDLSGNWPQWIEDTAEWISDKWNTLCDNVSKLASIVFTGEFFETVILSNVEADVGICIGIGYEGDVEGVHIEAVTRMDIVSIQFKDGKVRMGHDGRSAFMIGTDLVSVGTQNDTFETFSGEREVGSTSHFEVGKSYGYTAAFGIGYHYNISISFSGMFADMVDYIKIRW